MSEDAKGNKITKSKLGVKIGCSIYLVAFLLIIGGCMQMGTNEGLKHKAEPFFEAGYYLFWIGVVTQLINFLIWFLKSSNKA